jgi:ribosomal protein S18 acetylase RimI-like enzyme
VDGVEIRPLTDADEPAAEALLAAELGGRLQARLDGVQDVLALPGFGAWHDDRLLGLATYDPATRELAALAIDRDHRNRGLGGRLVEAVVDVMRTSGVAAVWLVTTNDNLDALRLYQRHGFRITRVDPGAVDRARSAHKPSIPMIGAYGIPLRDEIILERVLA